MSTWGASISSLLTTTTSRVATLRQNLLPSENDGDVPEDTHLARVLRSYYTEKGRGLPGWLPPDPKAPPPPVMQQPVYNNVGAGYGGGLDQGAGGGRAQLSSLWDKQGGGAAGGQPASLRQGRGVSNRQASPANPFAARQQPQQEVASRPLPSERAGSQQSVTSQTAATKLRDRFNRSGRASPASPASPAPQASPASYGPSSTGAGSNYEDRFTPPEGGYGGSRSAGADKPFVAATSPWASNEAEFGGNGYGAGGASARPPRQGLPTGGPKAGRGPGLPSGPRGYR